MTQQKHPTKQQIRQYLEARRAERCPPPSMQEIRRQLGWEMLRAAGGPATLGYR